jgi:hypothetical protein
MKEWTILIGCVAVLASCNKGPEVNLRNATGKQVTQAVKQSGVMTSGTMVEPGLWQSRVTVEEMNIPGLPPQYAAKMRQTMEEHQQRLAKHCLTPEQVKRPKEDFFAGEDKSCRYQHFTMGGGKIDIQMVCNEEGSTQTTSMNGTYTPTSYSMEMSSNGSGGSGQGMAMKMHVDAQRIGECTGNDG